MSAGTSLSSTPVTSWGSDEKSRLKNIRYHWSIMAEAEKPQKNWNQNKRPTNICNRGRGAERQVIVLWAEGQMIVLQGRRTGDCFARRKDT